ncbi:MAG: TolC family protein [Planctomycetota bacterium]
MWQHAAEFPVRGQSSDMIQLEHPLNLCQRLGVCLACLASSTLIACSVHEVDTNPLPGIDAPDEYASTIEVDTSSGHATEPSRGAWWHEFDDPDLSRTITESLASNLTAGEFAARVFAARAIARQAGAERLPALDGTGSLGWSSLDEDGIGDAIDRVEFAGDVGFVVSWEADVFGRLRSREQAAAFDAEAARDDFGAVLLSVSADVAAAYYAAVEQRLLLELLRDQIDRDVTLLGLIELRFAQGDATGLDILRQRAQLADARALVPGARAALRQAENALDALDGVAADGEDRVSAVFPSLPRVPAAGVPADLLANRPDLRAAQRRLVAVDFEIAEAIADRLPRFNIIGSLAYADAPSGSGFAASAAAGVVAPLIDWGRRQAVVDERQAEYQSLLAAYASLYVNAIAEVDTLLYAEQRTREEVAVLSERVDLLDRAVVEARNRYVNGIGDYTDVLIALDDLQETQRDLLSAEGSLVQQRIEVYRASGGVIGKGTDVTEEHLSREVSEASL